jgi:hypothetical protein
VWKKVVVPYLEIQCRRFPGGTEKIYVFLNWYQTSGWCMSSFSRLTSCPHFTPPPPGQNLVSRLLRRSSSSIRHPLYDACPLSTSGSVTYSNWNDTHVKTFPCIVYERLHTRSRLGDKTEDREITSTLPQGLPFPSAILWSHDIHPSMQSLVSATTPSRHDNRIIYIGTVCIRTNVTPMCVIHAYKSQVT